MPKIAKAQGRSVEEWIASSPDARIPKRVQLRIWRREDGRCYLTGKKIMPGDSYEFEHVKRLEDGGEHREGNIRLALTAPHKIKSAEERVQAARADDRAKSHIGLNSQGRRPFRSGLKLPPAHPGRRATTPLEKTAVGKSALARRFGLEERAK